MTICMLHLLLIWNYKIKDRNHRSSVIWNPRERERERKRERERERESYWRLILSGIHLQTHKDIKCLRYSRLLTIFCLSLLFFFITLPFFLCQCQNTVSDHDSNCFCACFCECVCVRFAPSEFPSFPKSLPWTSARKRPELNGQKSNEINFSCRTMRLPFTFKHLLQPFKCVVSIKHNTPCFDNVFCRNKSSKCQWRDDNSAKKDLVLYGQAVVLWGLLP